MKWNWETKGGFLTKIHPALDLNPDNIAEAMAKIKSEFGDYTSISKPMGRVDDDAAAAAAKEVIGVGDAKKDAGKGVIDVGGTRHR